MKLSRHTCTFTTAVTCQLCPGRIHDWVKFVHLHSDNCLRQRVNLLFPILGIPTTLVGYIRLNLQGCLDSSSISMALGSMCRFPLDKAGEFKRANHSEGTFKTESLRHAHVRQTTNGWRDGRSLNDNSGGFKLNMAAGKDVDENTQNRR